MFTFVKNLKMNNKSIEDKIMWECYIELFAKSTPSADFEKLVENATINEIGMKEIPFMDHEISEESFKEIMQNTLKKYKIPKWKKEVINRSVLLGCSPKFKTSY